MSNHAVFLIDQLAATPAAVGLMTRLADKVIDQIAPVPNDMRAGAIEGFVSGIIGKLLARHTSGDWGETCDEDCAYNDIDAELLDEGRRVVAKYKVGKELVKRGYVEHEELPELMVISQGGASETGGVLCTILTPEDY